MRKSKLFLIISLISLIGIYSNNIQAQDSEVAKKEESPLSVNCDIVSRFIWRGAVASPTLNFQPSINYSIKGFTIGTWGSGDILGNAKEVDIFMSYSIKNFSFAFTDYYWDLNKRYFNYVSENTGHHMDVGLSYENEKFPLKIYAGTMLYGADKKHLYDSEETDLVKNNYSTYFELSYTLNIKQNSLNLFVGATPFTGMYGESFNVIYTGLTASKEIRITEKYSLPIFTTIAVNPQTEDFYAVFGINL